MFTPDGYSMKIENQSRQNKAKEMTEKEKDSYLSEHVYYGRQMLEETVKIINKCKTNLVNRRDSQIILNACIESFGGHARAFIEFFQLPMQRRFEQDVRACLFVNATVAAELDKMANRLGDVKKRADRQLAHLSTDREQKEGWDMEKILSDLNEMFAIFDQARQQGTSEKTAATTRKPRPGQ